MLTNREGLWKSNLQKSRYHLHRKKSAIHWCLEAENSCSGWQPTRYMQNLWLCHPTLSAFLCLGRTTTAGPSGLYFRPTQGAARRSKGECTGQETALGHKSGLWPEPHDRPTGTQRMFQRGNLQRVYLI